MVVLNFALSIENPDLCLENPGIPRDHDLKICSSLVGFIDLGLLAQVYVFIF